MTPRNRNDQDDATETTAPDGTTPTDETTAPDNTTTDETTAETTPADDAPADVVADTGEKPADASSGIDPVTGGAPMLPGHPAEPVGPEDALGQGAKRGDYADRVDGQHAEARPVEGGGEPIYDENGNLLDYTPNSVLVDQTARTGDVGDAEGLKGGVDTATQ